MKRNIQFCLLRFFVIILIQNSYCLAQNNSPNIIILENVNVITMMTPNQIIRNTTVVINNNSIVSVNIDPPKNGKRIDAKGKWLIPGLIDMHVHLPNDLYITNKSPTAAADIHFDIQDMMTPFIANGITTIFNLNANVESFYQRKEIQYGNVIGPRIALARLIDGGNGNSITANNPDEGRQSVRNAKKDGYEFIKLYSKLNIETYNAIIDEAYIQKMKTVGHIPNVFQNDIKRAFIPHFNLVAHAEEFSKSAKEFSYEEALSFAKIAKENGSWVTPTLTAMDWIANQTHSLDRLKSSKTIMYIHPLLQSKWLTANSYYKESTPERITYFDQLLSFQTLLVRAFKEEGVPILAGTDAGVSGVVAGFSLHDELELLVKAGLTPEEALYSATMLPAQWLGLSSIIGTIEKGKVADLILLDDNPLEQISNTRKIAGVFIDGRWLEKSQINKMLIDLSNRNNEHKEKYDWKKIMNR